MPNPTTETQNAPGYNGRALLVLWGDVHSKDVDEPALNDWWTNEHLPERLSIPGFVRARRYLYRDDASNKTNYLTLYDVERLATLTSPDYMDKLNNPTAGTKKHIPTLAIMHRSACQVVGHQIRPELRSCGSTVGANVAMITVDLPDEAAVQSLSRSALDMFEECQTSDKALVSCSILQEDRAYTDPGSSSQSYSNITLKRTDAEGTKIIILIESSAPAWLSFSKRDIVGDIFDKVRSQALEPAEMHRMTYNLMCIANE